MTINNSSPCNYTWCVIVLRYHSQTLAFAAVHYLKKLTCIVFPIFFSPFYSQYFKVKKSRLLLFHFLNNLFSPARKLFSHCTCSFSNLHRFNLPTVFLENICDFIEFTEENQKSSQRYIPGPVFSFLRHGNFTMDFKLSDNTGAHKYHLGFTKQVKLSGGGKLLASSVPVPGVELDSHWIPFWVDLRKTGRVVIGTGSTTLINFTASDGEVLLPFLKFYGGNAGEQIIYCDKKGKKPFASVQ